MAIEFLIVHAGKGQSHDVIGGDHVTVKATGAETDNAFAVFETIVPPGAGPPRHVHHRESETFYILEGEFEFEVDGEKTEASVGDFLIAPPNVPHQFRNTSKGPGKVLVVCHPAGFEDFIREFATIPVDAAPDPAGMAAIGAKYGIEFLPSLD